MELPEGAKVSTNDEHPRWGDKSEWGFGPWVGEPDRVEWRIPGTMHGLVCLAVRGPNGSWCGYVGVPPGHPAHGQDYTTIESAADLRVHGGLTFADKCQTHEGAQVCHVPEPGEPDNVWWLGFDCAHSGDYSPAQVAGVAKGTRSILERAERGEDPPAGLTLDWLRAHARPAEYSDPNPEDPYSWGLGNGTYRRFEYVREEVTALAVQLAVMARQGLLTVLSQRAAQLEQS